MPRWPRVPGARGPTAAPATVGRQPVALATRALAAAGRLRLPLALALLLATLVALAPLLGERPAAPPSAGAPSPASGTAGQSAPAPGAAPLGSGLLLLPRGHTLDELDLVSGAERTLYDAAAHSDPSPDQFSIRSVVGATRSPDGRQVAYVEFRTGSGTRPDETTLYVRDGERTRAIASRAIPEVLANPTWSADGGGLIYQVRTPDPDGTVLEQSALDGTQRRTIETIASQPSLAPDGETLVFVRVVGDQESLIARPLAGGPARTIVRAGVFTQITSPRFSPDGRRIAFTAAGGATAPPQQWRPAGRLGWLDLGPAIALAHGVGGHPWLVDATGSALRQLPEVDEMSSEHAPLNVAWAPDGAAVALLSTKGLWLVPVDGAEGPVRAGRGGFGRFDWTPR